MPTTVKPPDTSGQCSWVEAANEAGSDFPLQNLPYGIFSQGLGERRVGVAIGDQIVDLSVLEAAGWLGLTSPAPVFAKPVLNDFMALGPLAWGVVRERLLDLLDASCPQLRDSAAMRAAALVRMADARLHLPFFVRSFTDFYASKEHATNVGTLLRGAANALPANWLHLPIGYNGRASTVIVSGMGVRRPLGQFKQPGSESPMFGPSRCLDFELELGAVVGVPSSMGVPVTVEQAWEMIFGFVLLNDWSARDIQSWEYQPLGPFQSKAFATTISPWVVTREALAPFRVWGPDRERPLLPYLTEREPHNLDIDLDASVCLAGREEGIVISRTNHRYLYYSPAQLLAHHAVGGCLMCTGDLLGSGTISGPMPGSLGSLIEITRSGQVALPQADGIMRGYLEDGDKVIFTGRAAGDGYQIGFGECAATILPSSPEPIW